MADLQARVRAHEDKGLSSKMKEAFESMEKEFSEQFYVNQSDDDKAKVFPQRFLQEVFGTEFEEERSRCYRGRRVG